MKRFVELLESIREENRDRVKTAVLDHEFLILDENEPRFNIDLIRGFVWDYINPEEMDEELHDSIEDILYDELVNVIYEHEDDLEFIELFAIVAGVGYNNVDRVVDYVKAGNYEFAAQAIIDVMEDGHVWNECEHTPYYNGIVSTAMSKLPRDTKMTIEAIVDKVMEIGSDETLERDVDRAWNDFVRGLVGSRKKIIRDSEREIEKCVKEEVKYMLNKARKMMR